MIDKSSLLKSQGSLYLEFISKDGLFHKMLLLSLTGFLTGWCNLVSVYIFLKYVQSSVQSNNISYSTFRLYRWVYVRPLYRKKPLHWKQADLSTGKCHFIVHSIQAIKSTSEENVTSLEMIFVHVTFLLGK